MPTHANALVIMAKAPLPGDVKTRLVPPLSPEEAAELSRCLLLDLIEELKSFRSGDLFIAFTPVEHAAFFSGIADGRFVCIPQRGHDLGERMKHIFEDLFSKGYKNIVVIGSDLPVFPSRFLQDAFMALDGSGYSVTFGPSRDGGYYLIGMNRYVPEIFQGIPWSSNSVLSTTVHKLSALELAPYFVPAWFDIDTIEDLGYLESTADQFPDRSGQLTLGFLNALASEREIWSSRKGQ